MHAGRKKISSEIKFWIIAFIWTIIYSVYSVWARGPCHQGMRKEPDFFCTIQVCQTQWDHFQCKTLCLWWCIYSCYSLHSMISLRTLQSVSSGLKLLNTLAHCCANEISDLGKSAYLNYAKNSSCRLLCMNALLIHHIIFSTVRMNLVRN